MVWPVPWRRNLFDGIGNRDIPEELASSDASSQPWDDDIGETPVKLQPMVVVDVVGGAGAARGNVCMLWTAGGGWVLFV